MDQGHMGRRYQLLLRLEEGAFAEHFKASADGAGEVWIKLISQKASDPAYGRALVDTGSRTRALHQPGALGFDEVGFVKGRLAAVRPYVEGYNLGDALRRLSTKEVVLPPAVALYIVAEAAQIVAAAHKGGWVHGAITPGNVLLGADGRVRVVDFGALEAMSASEPLRVLSLRGRNAYRAPELKAAVGATAAADVYSLGAIAYELLTLHEVAASRGGALSTKHDALTPPSRLDRRVNARIDPVVMRTLEHAATRRQKTAGDFADAVRGLFSTLGYAPSPAEAARFVKELFPNEVSVGAVGGPVPFAEPFTLEPVEGAAVTADIPAALAERAPYTSSQFPAVDPPEGPPATTEPEAPVAAVTVPPPKAKARVKDTAEAPVGDASDEWVAPPGAMPDAPRLTRRGGGAKREGEESSELSLAASKRIREFVEVSPGSATHDEGPEDDSYVFAEPAPQQPHTSLDWHTPPEPPREKPKPKTVGLTVWVLAAAICAAVAAFFYVAVGHKLGGHRSPIGTEAVGEPPDPSTLKPTPLEGSLRPPEPEKPPAPPPPDPKAPPTLVISADRPAQIFIDGQEMKFTTPATLRKLSPGAHTITLESDGVMREKRVVLKAGETEKVHVIFAGKKPKGEKR